MSHCWQLKLESLKCACLFSCNCVWLGQLNNAKKAETLFALNLKTSDGRDIDAKLFGKNKTVDDVNTVIDLERALHQVGPGTGRESDFDGAISLEPVEGSYVLPYETDGSMTPVTAFNLAMGELTNRFAGLNEEISAALKQTQQ